MERRRFVKSSLVGALSMGLMPMQKIWGADIAGSVPSFLRKYRKEYRRNSRAAALDWFQDAKFGMFIHYGLYSLLGQGEWIQYHQKIRVRDYEDLMKRFTAENFDADFITNLAIEAEMKYVNITTRHHDSFSLFNTKTSNFNSVKSPARRDLVEELANACAKKGLGLCLYYSHGRDWRHPHAPNNDVWGGKARPEYDPPEDFYRYGKEHDINKYVDFMHVQLTELLTQYGPVASIWLDGYGVPVNGPKETFRIPETYQLIRRLQSQCLISAKWGYNGEEDYLSPEIHWIEEFPEMFERTLAGHGQGKPMEFCSHIAGWGYQKGRDGKHRGAESIWENDIEYAAKYKANLLLNIAPRPDGDIDKQDVESLKQIGRRLREQGWPE